MNVPASVEQTAFAHHKIIVKPGSRKLAVFFSGSNTADYEFHFTGQAYKCGENALLVNNGPNHWYQSGVPGLGKTLPETISAIQALAASLGADEIYCIGASMGGSGALLYGSLLKAKVLAFGFETRIGLPCSRSEKLGEKKYKFPIKDLAPMVKFSPRVVAYIGLEDQIDPFASAHLAEFPNVEMTFMKGVQHGPPRYLKKRERLRPLIEAFLSDAEIPKSPEAVDLAYGFAGALYEGYCGFWTKNHARWRNGYQRALAIQPASIVANYWFGRVLIKEDRFDDAIPFLLKAKAHKFRESFYYHAHAVRRAGRHEEALTLHHETLAIWPDYPEPLLDLSTAHASKGEFRTAIAMIERLLEVNPDHQKAKERLASLNKKVGTLNSNVDAK